MKKEKLIVLLVGIGLTLLLALFVRVTSEEEKIEPPNPSQGEIYLYGEIHGEEKILERKFELWHEYYHQEGMRHFFIETSYFTGEFLNLWMQAEDDEILEAIYRDWEGTMAHNPYLKNFYRNIKKHCPETIFHGTDVGHNHRGTGQRFLKHLRDNDLEDTEQYVLTKEAIEQGQKYYSTMDEVYRENKMVENFIREFDKLEGKRIMGSYGAAHTGLDTMLFNESVPSMANQLQAHYGQIVHTEDLSYLVMMTEPERVDRLNILGKNYKAEYFGRHTTPGLDKYTHREFWRLQDAYKDFSDYPNTGNGLPYTNYPMMIETGEVYVIDYTKNDGEVIREYHRADGDQWEGMKVTVELDIE